MKQSQFESKYSEFWQQAEALLKDKFTQDNAFSETYRSLCHQLSIARSRQYSPSLVAKLELLVLVYHQELYKRKTHYLKELVNYFVYGFPSAIRRERNWVYISLLAFFGSLVMVYVSIQFNPDLVLKIVDGYQLSTIESMYEPGADRIGRNRESDTDFQMFGFYIYNNTSIGLRTYASGLVFTLGAFVTLLFNGLYIGAIAGHLNYIGYGSTFWPFVSGHSALELMAIVLSGAAGLKLGYSIISPGRKSRLRSLRDQAKATIYLMYGVIAMFVLAALIEAYWSSTTSIAPIIKYLFGGGFWLVLILYFIFSGRRYES